MALFCNAVQNLFLHIPTFQKRISQLIFLGANGNPRGSTMGIKAMKVMCTIFGYIVNIYDQWGLRHITRNDQV